MKQLLESFYSAFNELDAETMASCYHPEIVFQDPAFGVLKGERAMNMWRMLCESQKGKEFKITYSNYSTKVQLLIFIFQVLMLLNFIHTISIFQL